MGATGDVVRANLRRARLDRHMTLVDLERALAAVNHPIGQTALSKIEHGSRRVDVDDLTALASALNVSPLTLLMADADEKSQVVSVAGVTAAAESVWAWLSAERPLSQSGDPQGWPEIRELIDFQRSSMPWWASADAEWMPPGGRRTSINLDAVTGVEE